MKKIAFVFSMLVAVLVLAGCANKGTTDQEMLASTHPSQQAHHDYKGEMK